MWHQCQTNIFPVGQWLVFFVPSLESFGETADIASMPRYSLCTGSRHPCCVQETILLRLARFKLMLDSCSFTSIRAAGTLQPREYQAPAVLNCKPSKLSWHGPPLASWKPERLYLWVVLLSAYGLELALACTGGYLLASPSARTAVPEIKDSYFPVNKKSF